MKDIRFAGNTVRVLLFLLLACGATEAAFLVSHSIVAKESAPHNSTGKEPHASAGAKTWVIKTTFGTITLPEFEQAYRRINDKDPYATSLDSLKDFLTVYTDYRLKLEDAKHDGLDKDPKVLAEIKNYREMLAGPYLLDKELTEPAVKRLYAHRQVELHAAHFLASVRNPNDPADTLKGFKRAMEAIRRMNDGAAISEVVENQQYATMLNGGGLPKTTPGKTAKIDSNAWQGSDDKQTIKEGGDLGYFTGGMTVRAFEDAAYSLKPGEYTKYPVKTRFGYHVIQLFDTVRRIGGVRFKQIFISMPSVADDTSGYFHKIDSLYRLVKSGANFDTIMHQASEDKRWQKEPEYINREDRRAPLAFDRATYGLKDGEMSGIVRSPIGYHIILRTGTIPVKTFDQEKDQLKQTYKKYYFNEDKEHYMSALKAKYGLRVDSSVIGYFISHIDSTKTSGDSSWTARIGSVDRSKAVYHLNGESWMLGAMIDSLSGAPGSPLARSSLYSMLNKHIEEHALTIAARDIDKKYPEFEAIMQDYKNGIILFELENKRIWSKVVPDSAKELDYYNAHKAKFLWPERVDVSEIFVTSDSLGNSLYKRILSGENFDSLAKKYTERPGFKEKAGHWGLMQKDENELSHRAFDFIAGEVRPPFTFQGGYSIVRLNSRDPMHEKTFQEARQEVASLYQDDRAAELRLEWIQALRKKYKPQTNDALLADAWQKNHNPAMGANEPNQKN